MVMKTTQPKRESFEPKMNENLTPEENWAEENCVRWKAQMPTMDDLTKVSDQISKSNEPLRMDVQKKPRIRLWTTEIVKQAQGGKNWRQKDSKQVIKNPKKAIVRLEFVINEDGTKLSTDKKSIHKTLGPKN